MYRAYVYLVSVVLTGLVLWPAFRDPPRDSFPLSNYPMFSYGRPSPMLTMPQALGVHEDGTRTPLPPTISAGTYEVLQSMMTIDAAIRGGPQQQASLCVEIAARIADSGDDDLSDVEAVELAVSTFDCVAYFEGDTAPRERHARHRCEVQR